MSSEKKRGYFKLLSSCCFIWPLDGDGLFKNDKVAFFKKLFKHNLKFKHILFIRIENLIWFK